MNGELLPSHVTPGMPKKVWWRCAVDVSHEWPATVSARNARTGCPHCLERRISYQELRLAAELSAFLPVDFDFRTISTHTTHHVDIAVPALRLVVEYDGSYWHADREWSDRRKVTWLTNAGWRVIRVRERPLKRITEHDVVIDIEDVHSATVGVLEVVEAMYGMCFPGLLEYAEADGTANDDLARELLRRARERYDEAATADARQSDTV
jgi:very-short-patch-repair endonuclease